MNGIHRRLNMKSKTTAIVLIQAAILLVHCSAIVNPDPDSLDRRDGGDVDVLEDVDGQEDALEVDAQDIEEEQEVPEDAAARGGRVTSSSGQLSGSRYNLILTPSHSGGEASSSKYHLQHYIVFGKEN